MVIISPCEVLDFYTGSGTKMKIPTISDTEKKTPTMNQISGLTRAEHKAMDLTVQLWDLMVRDVIEDGPTGEQDRREFATQLHGIQHTIMAQAAARAHPNLYRLLGSSPLEETKENTNA